MIVEDAGVCHAMGGPPYDGNESLRVTLRAPVR